MQATHHILDTGWRVREVPRPDSSPTTALTWLPAQVPGHIHLDLERAGVIPNPFSRMHERGVAWVDETDWAYETTFCTPAELGHTILRFNGLDTVAEIELNDEPLAQTDNMFIAHEFDISGRLLAGENRLRVTFRSAMRVGRERQQAWNDAGNDTTGFNWFFWSPRCFVRKAQYMFGWDWGPELISCGIWRPVELITAPIARIVGWKYDVELRSQELAVVNVETRVERSAGKDDVPLVLETVFGQPSRQPARVDVPAGRGLVAVKAAIEIVNPILWRANGSGAANAGSDLNHLYDLAITLVDSASATIDTRTASIGLRTVELLHQPDPDGEGFRFRINGQDLFIKGANWIPNDSFPARIDKSTLRERLTQARDAGFNMLRVWGGGLYESEDFYDLCDELGILIWQDFPYACGYYPDTGIYAEAAKTEAAAAAQRIRNHPSIALWCGNNENQMMFHSNWTGKRPPRLLGEKLYYEILPAVLQDEDPNTPYWPSSPYGGEDPNSPDFGDRHNWDVWHGVGDWRHYASDQSRFCSEFGFASSCGMAAWDSCLAPADRSPLSPAVRWHDKTRKGYETYFNLFQLHFPQPQTLEELVYYSQLNQAEAMCFGVEHYRRIKGRCWGTLIWQMNDCWPVQSWSLVDYLGVPKAAYYAAKRFYAPVLISLLRAGDEVEVHLVNDLMGPLAGGVTVSIETFGGEIIAAERFGASLGANGAVLVGKMSLTAAQGRERESLVHAAFETGSENQVEALLLLSEPKELESAKPGISFTAREDGGRCVLSLRTDRFAPYVWIQVPGAGSARIALSDNFFHLRAGQAREIILTGPSDAQMPGIPGAIQVTWLNAPR